MTSIVFFVFLLAPYIAIIVLGYCDLDLGSIITNWDLNFWPKFFICFGVLLAYYFIIRTCINYFNGNLKRIIFFPVAFGTMVLGATAFILLYHFDVIDNFLFSTWSLVFMAYFAAVELFALLATFVRTFMDGRYHCPVCDRFRVYLLLDEEVYKQDFDVQKRASKLHSYQQYENTTVTTEVTATGRYGGQVNLDVKTKTHDNYRTEYYTTSKDVTKKFRATQGTVRCRRCGGIGFYNSVDPTV